MSPQNVDKPGEKGYVEKRTRERTDKMADAQQVVGHQDVTEDQTAASRIALP